MLLKITVTKLKHFIHLRHQVLSKHSNDINIAWFSNRDKVGKNILFRKVKALCFFSDYEKDLKQHTFKQSIIFYMKIALSWKCGHILIVTFWSKIKILKCHFKNDMKHMFYCWIYMQTLEVFVKFLTIRVRLHT